MARTIWQPSPGPDDPIFREGFTLSSARIAKGPAAIPASDASEKKSTEDDESKDIDSDDKHSRGTGRK